MYFKCSQRNNPETGRSQVYLRLVESYRNLDDRVCHRTLLNVGFMATGTTPEQLNAIQGYLNHWHEQKETLFEEEADAFVREQAEVLWHRLVHEKRIDLNWKQKAERSIDAATMRHSHVREIGSEWIAYKALQDLELDKKLLALGWSEEEAMLAAVQIVSRAVYPASELGTSRWINENSGVKELIGYEGAISKDKLYKSALKLFHAKYALERHLSERTNTLFDLEDKIILYDLTNTYFEGQKRGSSLAQFGRSKEKRRDAKLVVLALVINVEGFIKYSSILQGNIADSKTLSSMIDKLDGHTVSGHPIVVLDAGIATEENLETIRAKKYHYVCVSRSKIKDYEAVAGHPGVLHKTRSRQQITLESVRTERNTDYYLKVDSPAKAMKEAGMKTSFESRFELELEKIRQSLHKKGGVKKTDKVHERIGRAKQKYPSAQGGYNIKVVEDTKQVAVTDIRWEKDPEKQAAKEQSLGVYFVRTDLDMECEVVLWDIYNTIREIEYSFRTLKTDLDLRPIYHKNDESTMAHLHLGLLAYWLVNTVRYRLKSKGINSCWSEIVRIGNTQKIITTTGQNTFDKIISVRKCSQPEPQLKIIYAALNIPDIPMKKQKFVVHKPPS